MCTAFTHAFVAAGLGLAWFPRTRAWPIRWLAPVLAAAPDLDYGLHSYGVEYGDLWGHRGMTHSLLFAFVAALVVVLWPCRRCDALEDVRPLGGRWWSLLAFFFVVIASHGAIDAFTDGGLGIAFLSPFDPTRYFAPWTPVPVPNLGIAGMFTRYGLHVLLSEMAMIWLPAGAICATIFALRRAGSRRSAAAAAER